MALNYPPAMDTYSFKSKLGSLPLFDGLSLPEIEQLKSLLQTRFVPAAVAFITMGLSDTGVFVLCLGTAKVCVQDDQGDNTIVALCGPGDVLGEMDAIDHKGHSASVVTVEPCQFLWMSSADFNCCVDNIPRLSRNLLYRLVARERNSTNRFKALARLNLEGRVARQLLLLGDQYGVPEADGSLRLRIRPTQSEIASLVGSTRVCVNRVLSQMKKHDLISLHSDGTFILKDRERLHSLCKGCDV